MTAIMCGRFTLTSDANAIQDQFNLDHLMPLEPRYNIAPSENVLAIRRSSENKLEGVMLHWGLIPFWAKDKKISHSLINARAETVADKPAFRNAFKTHRCIVIMNGFFEWKRDNSAKKPFYFKSKNDGLLAVAALWDEWKGTDEECIQSCCLITTDANQLMQPIHERMPVLLDDNHQQAWLNTSTFDKHSLQNLLKPCNTPTLSYYPVLPLVNNARYKSADVIHKIEKE